LQATHEVFCRSEGAGRHGSMSETGLIVQFGIALAARLLVDNKPNRDGSADTEEQTLAKVAECEVERRGNDKQQEERLSECGKMMATVLR